MNKNNGREKEPYALITGASSGIGKGFAIESAKMGKNLALVALPNSGLEETAQTIAEQYEVEVRYLNIDLTDDNAVQQVYDWYRDNNLPVNLLVNNAGLGFGGAFEKAEAETLEKILQLNIYALTMLTHIFLPELKRHKQSYIINLSSMSGLHPVPYKTIYSASKSYVYYFSQGLREELKEESVNVSVVCPGPVITNPEVAKRVESQGIWAKLPLVDPEEVARKALRDVQNARVTVIPGWLNKLYDLAQQLVPVSMKRKIYYKRFRKFQDIAEESGKEHPTIQKKMPNISTSDNGSKKRSEKKA